MADLSNLNAISADDIVSRYHYKSGVPLFEKAAILFSGEITEKSYRNGKPINNLIEELEGRKEHFSVARDTVNNPEFENLNKFVFDMDRHKYLLQEFKFGYQQCYEGADRYLGIISELLRNP